MNPLKRMYSMYKLDKTQKAVVKKCLEIVEHTKENPVKYLMVSPSLYWDFIGAGYARRGEDKEVYILEIPVKVTHDVGKCGYDYIYG